MNLKIQVVDEHEMGLTEITTPLKHQASSNSIA